MNYVRDITEVPVWAAHQAGLVAHTMSEEQVEPTEAVFTPLQQGPFSVDTVGVPSVEWTTFLPVYSRGVKS